MSMNALLEDDAPEPAPVRTSRPLTKCEPGSAHLHFSKEVLAKDLSRHLVVSAPVAKPHWLESHTDPKSGLTELGLSSAMDLAAGRKHRVTISSGLVAVDGDRLASDYTVDFETADETPRLEWHDVSGVETVVEVERSKEQAG